MYIIYTHTYPSNLSYTFEMNSFENRPKKYHKSFQIRYWTDQSSSSACVFTSLMVTNLFPKRLQNPLTNLFDLFFFDVKQSRILC